MKPFLKWLGGKTQLLPTILGILPEKMPVYHEPFVGGGAVFFALAKEGRIGTAHLNDLNRRLMITYEIVKHCPTLLKDQLRLLADHPEAYYRHRQEFNALDPVNGDNHILIASLMIYLNKTCFNGLYRESKGGHMNSPYGRASNGKTRVICDDATIDATSAALRATNSTIYSTRFQDALSAVQSGEYVYLDPPYAPIVDSSFTGYTGSKFGDVEHEALAVQCAHLNHIGAKFLLSNSDVPLVRSLYRDFEIQPVQARRSINCKGTGRGAVGEVLIRNF